MFFRRRPPAAPSFQDSLENLRRAGFTVSADGPGYRVSRGSVAATLDQTRVKHAGILLDGELATLVDGGFQKFFRAPSGSQKPALAAELKALHAFEEDLREALYLTSLYNESLGTVSASYLYDRVKGRGDVLLK